MAVKHVASYKRKERNSCTRQRKAIIFLIAEGKNKTEKLYFQDVAKDINCIIKFAPGNYTDPENMVSMLVQFMVQSEFDITLGDKAYCLIDSDVDPKKNLQIKKAFKYAKEKGAAVILSVPCFEVWYISHFEYSTRQYNSNQEVVLELKKYIPEYDKNLSGIYEKTKSKIVTAINNAVRLEDYCLQNGFVRNTTGFMPSTDVYKVFKDFNY